jgi:hypothetical protein
MMDLLVPGVFCSDVQNEARLMFGKMWDMAVPIAKTDSIFLQECFPP